MCGTWDGGKHIQVVSIANTYPLHYLNWNTHSIISNIANIKKKEDMHSNVLQRLLELVLPQCLVKSHVRLVVEVQRNYDPQAVQEDKDEPKVLQIEVWIECWRPVLQPIRHKWPRNCCYTHHTTPHTLLLYTPHHTHCCYTHHTTPHHNTPHHTHSCYRNTPNHTHHCYRNRWCDWFIRCAVRQGLPIW